MNLIIHRGAHEIGGSCVELRSEGKSLLLDIGMPLSQANGARFTEKQLRGKTPQQLVASGVLPSVPNLYGPGSCPVVGVILSHSHLDHYGFGHYVRSDIPLYASSGTIDLMRVTSEMLGRQQPMPNLVPLEADWSVHQIGPFKVRIHPVDHSAPDAMAVEVEADGKKVFYSGDLRGHGRKKALFEHLVSRPPKDVDVLLMEGSSLGRGAEKYPTEQAVEEGILDYLKDQTSLAMLFSSGQNLDRVVTAFRVTKRTGKILVIDLYGAYVLHRLKHLSKNIPQYDWNGVRVKFWKRQQESLEKHGQAAFVRSVMFSRHGIKTPEIVERRNKVLMLGRSNSIFPRFIARFPVEGLKMMWSMWQGYLAEDAWVRPFCEKNGIELKDIHASGHATTADLKRLAQAINPRCLIPIHTMEPKSYTQFGVPVTVLADGQIHSV